MRTMMNISQTNHLATWFFQGVLRRRRRRRKTLASEHINENATHLYTEKVLITTVVR